MRNNIDLSGKIFNRLKAVKYCGKSIWLCECSCGNKRFIRTNSLLNNIDKSCGCYKKEATSSRFLKHGHNTKVGQSRTYNSWHMMIQRCTNQKARGYKNYGGRGITVCKRWLKFENFLKDMGERPKRKTLDRKNNNGNYCKSNCSWATVGQQNKNRRNNTKILYRGELHCISDLAKKFSLSTSTLKYRVFEAKWPISKALTHPRRYTGC
jgi:hypothetical protein